MRGGQTRLLFQTSQLNRPSLDGGRSPEGVIMIPMANITVVVTVQGTVMPFCHRGEQLPWHPLFCTAFA